jgi:hypothetical protein
VKKSRMKERRDWEADEQLASVSELSEEREREREREQGDPPF